MLFRHKKNTISVTKYIHLKGYSKMGDGDKLVVTALDRILENHEVRVIADDGTRYTFIADDDLYEIQTESGNIIQVISGTFCICNQLGEVLEEKGARLTSGIKNDLDQIETVIELLC